MPTENVSQIEASTREDVMAELVASDLIFSITPRAYTQIHGTSAQLIEDGLIPEGFQWPKGKTCVNVRVVMFSLSIRRVRPNGHKGPFATWAECDWWHVHRRLANCPMDGLKEATIYAQELELAKVNFSYSSGGRILRERCVIAMTDNKYWAMRTKLLSVFDRPKRDRKAKATY